MLLARFVVEPVILDVSEDFNINGILLYTFVILGCGHHRPFGERSNALLL